MGNEDQINQMLVAMLRVYADTEAMMAESYDLNPADGKSYAAAKAARAEAGPPAPIPEADRVKLTLAELHGFNGNYDGRILLSIGKELLDVTAGREMYGPGGSYAILAGRDVT